MARNTEVAHSQIDPRYRLAPELDPEFRENFITAPSHLKFPTRNQFAFLSAIVDINPAKERILVTERDEYFCSRIDVKSKLGLKAEDELSQDEQDRIFSDMSRLAGREITSMQAAVDCLQEIGATPLSLDQPIGVNDSLLIEAIPYISDDPEESAVVSDMNRRVRKLLDCLEPRERKVIKERFGLQGPPRTLDDIGKELGVTRERVRQIEGKALRKLRNPANGAGILRTEYLGEDKSDRMRDLSHSGV